MESEHPIRLAAVVCPNGLGHFRRLVGIVDSFRRLIAGACQITLVCEEWQLERMRSWRRLRELLAGGTSVRTGIMAPGVVWAADAEIYSDGRLVDWIGRLRGVEEIETADLVLCDNLPGILEIREDAVISGSFLWSDVLDEVHGDHPAVAALVARDRRLLQRHRPPMLCVGEMAMPGVLEQTAAVRLPWMCEDSGATGAAGARRPRVAVLGGATGSARDLLASATRELAADERWELSPAAGLLREAGPGAVAFGFTAADYAACDVAVCRPGMGTLSDCVAQGVPIVAVYEPDNPELRHNARRVLELGFGIDAGSHAGGGAIRRQVAELLRPERAAAVRRRLAKTPRDGLARAAAWICAARRPMAAREVPA